MKQGWPFNQSINQDKPMSWLLWKRQIITNFESFCHNDHLFLIAVYWEKVKPAKWYIFLKAKVMGYPMISNPKSQPPQFQNNRHGYQTSSLISEAEKSIITIVDPYSFCYTHIKVMKFDTNYKIYMWNMSMSDFYLHNLNLLVSMVTNFENKQNYKNGHIFVNF